MSNGRPLFLSWLIVILLGVTVFQIVFWGYLVARYSLGAGFGIEVQATIYEMLIGLIAIVASIGVFLGCMHAWKLDRRATRMLEWGAAAFFLKNVLDIANVYVRFDRFGEKTVAGVDEAALAIGAEVLQMLFWVFILWYFSDRRFAEMVEEWHMRPAPKPAVPPSSVLPVPPRPPTA